MNKDRRESIKQVVDAIYSVKYDVEVLQEEEQEYLDNMPDNLQYSERGEKAQQAIDALEEALSNLEEAISNLETAAE